VEEELQTEFDFLAIYSYLNPVLNAGIGMKHTFDKCWDLLCGFHTDFNMQRKPEDVDGYVIPVSSWDLYHFTGGANYKMKSSMLTLGVNYYFGIENNLTQIVNFNAPKDYLGLTGELSDDAFARIHGLAGVISFTYFFSQKE
jgi:hypothetical protein